jgi:hypothetical protein
LSNCETRAAYLWEDKPESYKLRIEADSVVVTHCKLFYLDLFNKERNLTNITITKSFFNPGLISVAGGNTISNLIISNNFFRNDYNPQYTTSYWISITSYYLVIDLREPKTGSGNPGGWRLAYDFFGWPVVQPTIQNNTFYAYFNIAAKSARLYNNIFFPKQSSSSTYFYGLPIWPVTAEHDAKNNIVSTASGMWTNPVAQTGTDDYAKNYGGMLNDANNTYSNITETSWFASSTTLPALDKSFVLGAGSPAAVGGDDTKQRGMFGGLSPYILSGLYTIPAVWEISIPAYPSGEVPSTGFEVRVKVKSH